MVTACSSGDSAETDTYIKFYNASADAPSIFMTLDEDLDNDADDELIVQWLMAMPALRLTWIRVSMCWN